MERHRRCVRVCDSGRRIGGERQVKERVWRCAVSGVVFAMLAERACALSLESYPEGAFVGLAMPVGAQGGLR